MLHLTISMGQRDTQYYILRILSNKNLFFKNRLVTERFFLIFFLFCFFSLLSHSVFLFYILFFSLLWVHLSLFPSFSCKEEARAVSFRLFLVKKALSDQFFFNYLHLKPLCKLMVESIHLIKFPYIVRILKNLDKSNLLKKKIRKNNKGLFLLSFFVIFLNFFLAISFPFFLFVTYFVLTCLIKVMFSTNSFNRGMYNSEFKIKL